MNAADRLLVRVRQHLFLPRCHAHRSGGESARGQRALAPFLLGPIFFDQGWRNSPFNIYPAKGRYMWRDLERICGSLGLPFARPDPFPQNSLTAARLALAVDEAERPAFTRAVYAAQFGERRQIAGKETLAAILAKLQLEPHAHFARASSDAIKMRL